MQNITFPTLQNTKSVFYTEKNEKLNTNNAATPINNSENLLPQKVFAKHLQARGINFRGVNITQALDDYKWFINVDKTPPFVSFLKISTESADSSALYT